LAAHWNIAGSNTTLRVIEIAKIEDLMVNIGIRDIRIRATKGAKVLGVGYSGCPPAVPTVAPEQQRLVQDR